MSSSAVVEQGHPSPPLSDSRELQPGFHQLIQHNAAMKYQTSPYVFDNIAHEQHGFNTAYDSPGPSHVLASQYGNSPLQGGGYQGSGYPGQEDLALSLEYVRPNNPYYHPAQGNRYGYDSSHFGSYPPFDSEEITGPPTPITSDHSGGGRRITRNNRNLAPNDSTQIARTDDQDKPRSIKLKRPTKKKGDKPKIPIIDAPLSELTKGMDIPIKDIAKWVHRPTEVRLQEVKEKKGYVTRPMNSFMLYRSAYAERTKVWCTQNNHQVVSSVSGESWPLEPPNIRDMYTEYATIERNNHKAAHPNYKFSPSKAQTPGRKRKGATQDIEANDASELEDSSYKYRSRPKAKRSRKVDQEQRYTMTDTPINYHAYGGLETDLGLNRSSYQVTNPGKLAPAPLDYQGLPGNRYYQPTIHPSPTAKYVEDVTFQMVQAPTQNYSATQPLVGLPGAQHDELLEEGQFEPTPVAMKGGTLDPALFNQEIYSTQLEETLTEEQIQEFDQYMQSHRYPGEVTNPTANEQWPFISDSDPPDGDADFGI